jgi:hypothetical protein
MRAHDTDAAAHRAQLAVYARMTPSRRVELAFELSERARRIATAGIRSRHPNLTAEAAHQVLLRNLLGEELHRAAYPVARPPPP